MFRRSRLALSVAAAVGAIMTTGSVAAVAQEAAASQIEEGVVTGSRIKRTDLTSLSLFLTVLLRANFWRFLSDHI